VVWWYRNEAQTLKHEPPHDPLIFAGPNGYGVFKG
jgi:hypothetical protein